MLHIKKKEKLLGDSEILTGNKKPVTLNQSYLLI